MNVRAFLFLWVGGWSLACSEYDLTPKTEAEGTAPAVDTSPPEMPPVEDTNVPVAPPDTGFPPEEPPPDTGVPPDCGEYMPEGIPPVEVDDSCVRDPEVGSFTPVIEWQWNTNPIHSAYNQVMSTPAIANLTDDNADGRIDEDDIPDVVFTSFAGSAYSSPGVVTAIRGDDGATLWSVSGAELEGHAIYSAGGVAMADLDGDGNIEVCVAGVSQSVVCLNGVDGSFKWAGGSETSAYGCPAIADLDGDGYSEVIFGRTVLDHLGDLVFQGTGGYGGSHRMSFAIDWDLDGTLDVIAGNTVYRSDGSILWSDSHHDSAPAVGDFNLDGLPDLVRAGMGWVSVHLNDGTELWKLGTSGGGSAGPPTVADFDGDGLPEVGVADLSRYTVYDTDGTPLWSNETSDHSSSKTGSSVFDFEGDGAAEVVYADEHTLWIYDGATGAVKMAQDGHASGTLMEYPLIADVDNDGSTEIIVASNNYTFDGWTGITVIGDEAASWAPARPIWNQYAYHITNINNDGTVPVAPPHNWLTWNNFRTGGTELGPSHWLPDLNSLPADICLEECWNDMVTLSLPVTNEGLLNATEVVVWFERSGGTLAAERHVPVVPSGVGRMVGPITFSLEDWGSGVLFAVVDAPDDTEECAEDNNRRSLGVWPCPTP
jgi:hypothetical protein